MMRIKGARRARRGGAMVFVTVFLTVLGGMAFSMMVTSLGTMGEQRGSREKLDARFCAEGALSEAMFDLETGGDGVIGNQEQPMTSGGNSYWVTSTDAGGGVRQLVATCEGDRANAQIELVLREVITNMFAWAAFGDEGLSMQSNSMVDSYNSSLGTYADQEVNGSGASSYASTSGNVGSNGDIVVSQNADVHGDATPGPGGTTTIIGTNAHVDGSTAASATTMDLPPIVVPSIPSSGSVTVVADMTLASGDHHFDSMTVSTGTEVWVTGPATLVFGSFELASNTAFRVDATAGPVEIYVIDDFVMNSNTLIASSTYTPADIAFNLLSDNVINPEVEVDLDDVEFESNAELYGTIYAPNAAIEIDSNFELFGALVARSIVLDSNSQIHYDEALLDAANQEQTTYEVVCQRVLK